MSATAPIDCNLLQQSALGRELDPGECHALASVMGQIYVKQGETLVSEGEKSPTLFILVSGSLSVISNRGGRPTDVYTMSPGTDGIAGTRAFVDGSPRKATLKARTDSLVYTLQPGPFESLLESHPRVVYKVMRGLFCITHTNLMRMNTQSQDLVDYIQRSGGKRY